MPAKKIREMLTEPKKTTSTLMLSSFLSARSVQLATIGIDDVCVKQFKVIRKAPPPSRRKEQRNTTEDMGIFYTKQTGS